MFNKELCLEQIFKKGGTVYYPEHSNITSIFIGKRVVIHSHVWIGDDVVIGDDVRIQAFAFIPNGVNIKSNVFVGPRVTFTNDKYPPSEQEFARTLVEEGVSIGAAATILPGITLGKGCKIGAGAVVTKNVPAGETWVGNPARKL